MNESTPAPTPEVPATPQTPTLAAPPAAAVVATGTRTEREVDLEAELATERERHTATANEKKAREVRVAELEDELHRLKTAGAVPPRPTTAPRTASGRSWTLFPEEEA